MSKQFYHIWIIIVSVSSSICSTVEAINLKAIKTEVSEYSDSSDAKCRQNSVTKTRCDCRNDSSSSSISGVNCAKPSKLSEILSGNNLLDLQPLNISSGASSLITDKQIAVKFDYTAYGITDTGVLFHITEPPKYGTLEIEIWHRSQWQYANAPQLPDSVFTLHDLRTNKVRYTHDGVSRHHNSNDSVRFQLEFHSTFYQLPGFLHGMRYTFTFEIIIAPEIQISTAKKPNTTTTVAIELTRDTKRVITGDILSADYEHNTDTDQIKYQLVNIVNSDQSFFANTKNPDSPITSFTQRDIDHKLIEFAHKTGKHLTDNKEIKVLLKVSSLNYNHNNKTDDRVITLVIKIIERPFSLSLVSHSSVQLLQGRNRTKILAKHLAVVSNDSTALQANHIYYTVREAPHHGFISVDDRNNVSAFSQNDIDAMSVAYVQVNKASTDLFTVDITASNGDQTLIYDTNITVVIVTKALVRFKKPFVNVSSGQRVVITAEYLDASELASITNSTPTFVIISSPKYGYLRNVEHSGKNRKRNINAIRKQPSKRKSLSEFTHEDIIKSRIVYIAEYDITNDRTTQRDNSDTNHVLIDVVKYEISSRGVASALGKLVINVFTADIISDENHYENRYNVTNHLIDSSGNKDSKTNNNNNGVIDMFPSNKKLNVSGYLNIYISSDELLIALVLVLSITTIIALIFITRCCRVCSKTAHNTQTIKCTANSVDGSEMAMIAHRSSPTTSAVPPSVVSDIADSVRIDLDNFRTNSATPTSITLTTNCSVSNVCTPHSIDFGGGIGCAGDQPKLLSSIYPLPPPSLYFTSGSASDIYPMTGTAKWPKCSARTCRVTPIVPNCVDGCGHYCAAIHCTLHHQYMASLAADRASVPVLNKLQHSCSANELYESANNASSRVDSPSVVAANCYADASNATHHCDQCYSGCNDQFNDDCVYPSSYHQFIGGDNMFAKSYSTQTYPKPKQQFYV